MDEKLNEHASNKVKLLCQVKKMLQNLIFKLTLSKVVAMVKFICCFYLFLMKEVKLVISSFLDINDGFWYLRVTSSPHKFDKSNVNVNVFVKSLKYF